MADTALLTDGFGLIFKELEKVEAKLKEQVEKERKRHEKKFCKPFGYDCVEEAREDYGYGAITEAKFNKVVERFESGEVFRSSKLVALNLVRAYKENLQLEKTEIERSGGKGYSKFLE